MAPRPSLPDSNDPKAWLGAVVSKVFPKHGPFKGVVMEIGDASDKHPFLIK